MSEDTRATADTTQSMESEAELLSALKSGKEEALHFVIDKYARAAAGVIFRIVQSAELTEELLKETFVQIWNEAGSYDPAKGRVFTWIISVARKLAIDKTRSAGYKVQQKSDASGNSVDGTLAKDLTVQREEAADMGELLERLNMQQKDLIELIYFQGYTQSAVAEKLKIPVGTVKTRVRSAVMELRKFYNVNY